MMRDDPFAQVVVPDHKEIDSGTLRATIRRARAFCCGVCDDALRGFDHVVLFALFTNGQRNSAGSGPHN